MTNPHRSALVSTGLAIVLASLALPATTVAQRQQLPGPDTKKVLVTTFRGDVEGGIRAAEEIRNRIKDEYSIRTLMPNPKKDIDNALTSSGYPVDSALSPADIKELARQLRADEIIDGNVSKTAAGYRLEVRFFLPRDVSLSQPLGVFESKDFGDLAKKVVDEYDKARKQIPENQACENGIRGGKPSDAIQAARKGIQIYTKATLTRLCMASAFAAMKLTPDSTGPWKDSVIAVTGEIIKLDPVSRLAFELAIDAFVSKKDTASAVRALSDLLKADPTDKTLVERGVSTFVLWGYPKLALPYLEKTLADNPLDPQIAKTYWQVLRMAEMYKQSVPAGVAWVAMDSASADSSYFLRQISDLAHDSLYAKAAEFAGQAVAKYPKSVYFLSVKAQNERRSGQMPAAKATLERILQIDPKAPLVAAQLATILNDLGQVDEAVKVLKADAAVDPSSKDRDAALVLQFGRKLYDAAAASKSPADYLKALPILQASDAIAPTEGASYFIAVTAYGAVSDQERLKGLKTCEDFKGASDLLSLISQHMPKGGRLSPETARGILGYVPQLQSTFIDPSIKKLCK